MKRFRAESRLESAEGASAIEGHLVAMEPRTICRTISRSPWRGCEATYRAREHVSEEEPHALRQTRMLRVEAPDEPDKRASAVVGPQNRWRVLAPQRVARVVF